MRSEYPPTRMSHPTTETILLAQQGTRGPARRSPKCIQEWVHDQQLVQAPAKDACSPPPGRPDASVPSAGYQHVLYRSPPHPFPRAKNHILSENECDPPCPTTAACPSACYRAPLALHKRLGIPAVVASLASDDNTTPTRAYSPSPSYSSINQRPEVAHTRASHTRDFRSASPSLIPSSCAPPGLNLPTSKSPTWKLQRPTVLGHFLPVSEGQLDDVPRPRPSTSSHSSSTTFTVTQPSTESLGAPPKLDLSCSRPTTQLFRSSTSLWSLPTDASHLNDPPNSTKVIARDRDSDSTFRRSLRARSSSSALNILTGSKKKKRKLIISGVPTNDYSRLEAVRRWCESFGEVNQMSRVPNGDLHVEFRRAEVADTVCRLHARVYITGVGSVGLSWFTGKRP